MWQTFTHCRHPRCRVWKDLVKNQPETWWKASSFPGRCPFPRVLYALGIRYVGETVARKLAEAFLSLDRLMEASQEELEQVDEIGERIAQSLRILFPGWTQSAD
jgi:NAD-dependent DNA ligase